MVAGQFNLPSYGVRTGYGMKLILSSTDKVQTESALQNLLRVWDGIRRFTKMEVRVRVSYPYLHSGEWEEVPVRG